MKTNTKIYTLNINKVLKILNEPTIVIKKLKISLIAGDEMRGGQINYQSINLNK